MKYSLSITALALVSTAFAAYVPSEPWSTLTPLDSVSGAMTDYSATFGIAIEPITQSSGSSVALKKRDVVTQIGDGQIQATTSTASTSTKAKTTSTSTAAAVVTQIGDGQIQADTTTTSSSKKTTSTSTAAAVVTQIGDGQIQADTTTTSKKTTSTSTAAAVVTQIGDGQIQASTTTTSTATSTGTNHVVTQISDGQLQASTTTSSSKSSSTSSSNSEHYVNEVACYNPDALAMSLKGGVLTDAKGRIGSIVASRQFQFDGPTPQAGAIYAAGWSISSDGYLTLGNDTVFYQCLSGTFYNLYDESLGIQCHQVHLKVLELVDCNDE